MKRPVTLTVAKTRQRAPWAPPSILRAGVALRNVVVETYNGFNADRGLDLAGSLAFATLLLAVPLLATFALLFAAFFQDNVNEIVDLANRILPFHAARLSENLREFIRESLAISGIGLAVLIGSSIRMIFIVEGIFNAVWGAPRRRAWMPRIAIYSLMLLAGALLAGALALGFRRLRSTGVGGPLLGSPDAEHALRFAIEWAALTLLYKFLPNAYVRWTRGRRRRRPHVDRAGIPPRPLRPLRARALVHEPDHGLPRPRPPVALLHLSPVGPDPPRSRADARDPGADAASTDVPGALRAGRAENAIRMLLRLTRGETDGFRELYEQQEADAGEAEQILKALLEKGIIEGDPSSGYRLAHKPWQISVAEVVEAISPDLFRISPHEQDRVVLVLEPLFARLEKERRALLGATLADLQD